jgi:hypothetical protein
MFITTEFGTAIRLLGEVMNNDKEEAERFHTNLSKQMSNVKQVKEELEHIRSPYSLNQILDLYCKGDYNAELLLQHSLRILINNNFKYNGTENI